jgi:hypothetical protein
MTATTLELARRHKNRPTIGVKNINTLEIQGCKLNQPKHLRPSGNIICTYLNGRASLGMEASASAVVKEVRYKSEGRGFENP